MSSIRFQCWRPVCHWPTSFQGVFLPLAAFLQVGLKAVCVALNRCAAQTFRYCLSMFRFLGIDRKAVALPWLLACILCVENLDHLVWRSSLSRLCCGISIALCMLALKKKRFWTIERRPLWWFCDVTSVGLSWQASWEFIIRWTQWFVSSVLEFAVRCDTRVLDELDITKISEPCVSKVVFKTPLRIFQSPSMFICWYNVGLFSIRALAVVSYMLPFLSDEVIWVFLELHVLGYKFYDLFAECQVHTNF